MKVGLICCGRLENRYAVEFVEHYKQLGFDNIHIMDNNHDNEEHFEDVLQQYIDKEFVIIHNYRNIERVQDHILEIYYKISNEYDWIFFCDFDEFLILKEDKTIQDYLSRDCFKYANQILINWSIYTDNDLIYDDGRSCLERFDKKCLNHYMNTLTKPFIKTKLKDIKYFTVHCFNNNILFNTTYNNKGDKIYYNELSFFFDINYDLSYIKHFTTKTIDEYINNKLKRGTGDRSYNIFLDHYDLDEFFRVNEMTTEKLDYLKKHNIDISNLLSMKTIKDLSDEDLYSIKYHGYIINKMKYIAELQFFYNQIDEEIKRRDLKRNQ